MAWPTQYPTNAGELLFGPLTEVLRSHFQEVRARAEREDVRRQAKEQYDRHFAFLKEQAAQQATQRMFATKDPAAALAQLPEVESYRSRLGAPPLGTGSMTPISAHMAPSMQEGPPEMVPAEAVGPPTASGEPAQRMVPSGLPTWEPTQVVVPARPPEHAVARSYWEKMQQDRANAIAEFNMQYDLALGKALGGVEGARLIGLHSAVGQPEQRTRQDVEAHAAARQAEIDAERQARIMERLAGRRPPAGPRPQKPPKLTLPEAYALIDSGDPTANEAISRMVPEAKTPEQRASVVDSLRRKRTADLLAKAERFKADRASQAAAAALRAAQANYDKVAKDPMTRFDDAAKAEAARGVGAAAAAVQNALSAAAVAPGFAVPGATGGSAGPVSQPEAPAAQVPTTGAVTSQDLQMLLSFTPAEQDQALRAATANGYAFPAEIIQAPPAQRNAVIRRLLGAKQGAGASGSW